ncbi:ubiquitin-conjugating enzyme E2 J1-like [Styela clava]|uniref:ubiquitin-conjugating enzyme E2 J1-like n=1 Tax=Styela clava TaxID=7725 RepID=UPI0019399901|nr:ubiquitin-conjugating enzyme E2 J1-like [Styela clava]
MAQSQYNFKNPAVKRLMREAQELKDATEQYSAQPLDDNLFEWHFTFRGPSDSDFDGGMYHGRIILPPEYPMKPPSIMLLTPNGRFELHKKICLSISGYHPESWQPSWSIRTAILAIIGFMPTKGEGAIGALDYSPQERKNLAKKSSTWSCQCCGSIKQLLKEPGQDSHQKTESEIRDEELAKQINFSKPKTQTKSESEKGPSTSTTEEDSSSTPPNTDGLRQRQTSPPEISSIPPPTTPQQPAPQTQIQQPPPQQNAQRHQEDSTPFMLIIVLSVVLAVLLLRRLDRVYDLRGNLF